MLKSYWRRLRWLSLPLLAGVLVAAAHSPAESKPSVVPRLRRPVALVLADEGKWLYAANQRSGTLSIIDVRRGRLVNEVDVGRRLSDLAVTPEGGHLIATDEEAHELVVLSRRDAKLERVRRVSLAPSPVSVRMTRDGERCVVASLWSRQLTVIELGPAIRGEKRTAPRIVKALRLPFPPRNLLLLPGQGKLVVADAFGGRLALIDVLRFEIASVRRLPAHNIRGLAISPDGQELLIAHQVLNGAVETTLDNVHWGNVVTNNVRAVSLKAVLDPAADLTRASRLYPIDEVSHGGGDPAGLAVVGKTVAVALGGTGEVALEPQRKDALRLRVGRRPTALAGTPDGRFLYAANTFGDSISVIDLPGRTVVKEIVLGEPGKLGLAEQGELLFHDSRLSHDGWLSCHSCHTDGHTNGLLNDNQGDGSFGAPKRVLSLRGVKDTGPWAWNGGMSDLETQVRKSIRTTMRGRNVEDNQVRALTAYLRTLTPPPPLAGIAKPMDQKAVQRGSNVFDRQGCAKCHAPPSYTSARTYKVGLTDEVGNTQFNPPSLRGVGQGGPYFHDGRASSLEEVFTRHRHQLGGKLTDRELADLLAYLRSL